MPGNNYFFGLNGLSSIAGLHPEAWYKTYGLQTNTTNHYGTVNALGKITQLTDFSSYGNNAVFVPGTGTAPSLSGTIGTTGRAAAYFDGVDNNLQIENKALINNVGGATVFIVCKATSIVQSVTENELFFMSTAGSDNGRFSISIDTASDRYRTRCRRLDADVYADSHQLLGSADVTNSKVIGLSMNWATGMGVFYENGEVINWDPKMNVSQGNTSATDSRYACIGALISLEGDGNFPFNGHEGEIVFWNRALSVAEMATVCAELQAGWGIASPSDYAMDPITTAWLAATGASYSTNWVRCFNNLWAKQRAVGNVALSDGITILETESQTPALTDCINTARAATYTGTPTWDTRGFTFNGTNNGLNTNFNPSADGVNFTQNSAMFFAYGRRETVHAGVIGGCKDATSALKLYPRYTDGKLYSGVNETVGANLSITNYTGFGMLFARRTTAGSENAGINNDILKTQAQASNGRPNKTVKIGYYDNNGVNAEFWAGQVSCYGFVSAGFNFDAWEVDYKTFEAGIGILS